MTYFRLQPFPHYFPGTLDIHDRLNPESWTSRFWAAVLLNTIFVTSDENRNEPVWHMPGSWEEVADAISVFLHHVKPDIDAPDAATVERLLCLAVGKDASDVKPRLQFLSTDTGSEPTYLAHLVIACVAVGEADGGQYPHALDAQFEKFFTNRPWLRNRHPNTNACFLELQRYLNSERLDGRPVRPLLLRDPGGMVNIGYVRRLSFPSTSERRQLAEKLGQARLHIDDPSPGQVFRALERVHWSDRFRESRDDFRERFVDNKLRPFEPWWSLIERTLADLRRAEATAPTTHKQLEFALYDTGDSAYPVLHLVGEGPTPDGWHTVNSEQDSLVDEEGLRLLQSHPGHTDTDPYRLGRSAVRGGLDGLSNAASKALTTGLVGFRRVSDYFWVQTRASDASEVERVMVRDDLSAEFEQLGWEVMGTTPELELGRWVIMQGRGLPQLEQSESAFLERRYTPLQVRLRGGFLGPEGRYDSHFPPTVVLVGAVPIDVVVEARLGSSSWANLPKLQNHQYAIPSLAEAGTYTIRVSDDDEVLQLLTVVLAPLPAGTHQRARDPGPDDGWTVDKAKPYPGERLPWAPLPVAEVPLASRTLLEFGFERRRFTFKTAEVAGPTAPHWAFYTIEGLNKFLVRLHYADRLEAVLPAARMRQRVPSLQDLVLDSALQGRWETWARLCAQTSSWPCQPHPSAETNLGTRIAALLIHRLENKSALTTRELYELIEDELAVRQVDYDRALIFSIIRALGENAILERWYRPGYAQWAAYHPVVPRLVAVRLTDTLYMATLTGLYSDTTRKEVARRARAEGLNTFDVASISPFVPPTVRLWSTDLDSLEHLSAKLALAKMGECHGLKSVTSTIQQAYPKLDEADQEAFSSNRYVREMALDVEERRVDGTEVNDIVVECWLNPVRGYRVFRVVVAGRHDGHLTWSREIAFQVARIHYRRIHQNRALLTFGYEQSPRTSGGLHLASSHPRGQRVAFLPMPIARLLTVMSSQRSGPILRAGAVKLGATEILANWEPNSSHAYAYVTNSQNLQVPCLEDISG